MTVGPCGAGGDPRVTAGAQWTSRDPRVTVRPWGLVGTPGPWQGPQGAGRDPRMTAGPWRAGGDPRVTVGPQGAGRTLVRWQGPQKAGGTPGSCWGPRGASGNPTKPAGTLGSCRGPRGAGGTPGNPVPLQLPVPPPVSPSTIVVEPGCTASLTRFGDICIAVGSGSPRPVGPQLDAVQLSIFSHRFMSIAGAGGLPPSLAWGRGTWRLGFAMDRGWDEGGSVGQGPPREGQPRSPPPPAEQMGRILQRTAISTNIKERLDFSCALFGPDGGLVSNAPHIPVHLGAMQETVQFQVGESPGTSPAPGPPPTRGPAQPFPVPLQIRNLGEDLREGDVILSNHPCAGGSHLPDLTVITPVSEGQGRGTPTPGHPWGAGPPTKTPAQHQALPRSSGRASPSPSSSWPAAGTTRTSGASPPAPCPPTLRLCVRRGPSSSPSSW